MEARMRITFLYLLPNDVVEMIYRYIHSLYVSECIDELNEYNKKNMNNIVLDYSGCLTLMNNFDDTCVMCFNRNKANPTYKWIRCIVTLSPIYDRLFSIIDGKLYYTSDGESPHLQPIRLKDKGSNIRSPYMLKMEYIVGSLQNMKIGLN